VPIAEAKPAPAPAPATPNVPAAPVAANTGVPGPVAEPPRKKRNSRRLLLMVSVPVVLLVAGGWLWVSGGRYVDTDNAYVQQAKVSISPDIAGRIATVSVGENQMVKSGDVLFTIDPASYQIALDQANAALASARVNVQQLKVAFVTAQTQLKSAQATLDLRQAAYDRQAALVTKGVNSNSTLDDVKLALQQAQAAVDAANQQVAGATAALGGDPNIDIDKHPAVLASQAQVEQAQRNLSKTTVTAPAAGIVSNVASLNVGQFVAAGTTIASLVETDGTWIEANFKETQLTDIRAGQPAEVSIDAYPGKIAATVESLGAATGSEFSLIPAQNATGNWVKVVQRIPVRIKLADSAEDTLLKTGMSATVTVDTGKSTLDKLMGH
jgi:membrane fusion protein (multidrug efflux system)